jgi:hypothetical protein
MPILSETVNSVNPSIRAVDSRDDQSAHGDAVSGMRRCAECGGVYPNLYFDGRFCWDCAEPRGRWGRKRQP